METKMMFKKILLTMLAAVLTLSAIPVYGNEAAENEYITYDKELYYIGSDIPADSYILVSKDVTKPAYYGVYTNYLMQGAEFVKKSKLLSGTEEDYIYPHYFENNSFYSYSDPNVPDNQGNLKIAQYFEYSTFVDLSDYKLPERRNDFLYLENCYAVSVKDIDKVDLEFQRDGFFPVKNNLTSEKSYKITVSDEERMGFMCFYRYDKFTKKLVLLSNSNTIYNSIYSNGTNSLLYGSSTITVPKKADVILKVGVNVCELNGDVIYPAQGITFPDDFTEKYNFNDVSTTLKTAAIQEFKGLRQEEIATRNPYIFTKTTTEAQLDRRRIFKSLAEFAKTEADYEYIKYVREAYVMYSQAPYVDLLIGKYLYNATCYEDLSILLRRLAYNDYRSAYYVYSIYSPNSHNFYIY